MVPVLLQVKQEKKESILGNLSSTSIVAIYSIVFIEIKKIFKKLKPSGPFKCLLDRKDKKTTF